MKKLVSYLFLICFIFIVGCEDASTYDDKDVAAIVKGEEITIGELRFFSPDDHIFENLDGMIKIKLAMQEVKEMNLDVSEELQEIQDRKDVNGFYPADDDNTEVANSIRAFAKAKSKKFGMKPEEYYEEYIEITQEMSVYVVAYVEEMLGEPEDNLEEYTEKENQLLDKLVEENEAEIEILIP